MIRKNIFSEVICTIIIAMCACSPVVSAFGKNKISYKKFKWMIFQTDHFDFYYYPEEKNLLPEVIRDFEEAYNRISTDLDTQLSDRTPVILYRTHREFEQTNIMSGFIPQSVGGFSEPIKRRVVIPLEGSHIKLKSLIIHELVHIFQFEILFQNRISRMAPVPIWVMEGYAEHISRDWNAMGRMVLRDAEINNLLPDLRNLDTFDHLYSPYLGYKAAQSAVDFIRKKFGIQALRNLLWEMRKLLRTPEFFPKAVKDSFDMDINRLSSLWKADLRKRIIELERRREGIENFPEAVADGKPFHRRFSPVFTPGGELVAYLESGDDGFHIYIGHVDPEKQGRVDCLTCGLDQLRYRRVITDGRPLGGNPWDDRLVYFSRYEDKTYLNILDPAIGGLADSILIPYDIPTSPALSPNGTQVAFAAFEGGQSDIFIIDLKSKSTRRVTDDVYIDETPCWSPDGTRIVYASERSGEYDLYKVNVDDGIGEALVTTPGNQTAPSWSKDGKSLAFISDGTDGVDDPYILDIETGNIRRLAAPVTGMFTPVFSPDSETVAVGLFNHGSENIVFLSRERTPDIPEAMQNCKVLDENGETTPPTYSELPPAAAVPDSVNSILGKKAKFRLIPDMAVGQIGYGTDDDFSIEGGVVLSDVLGDHRFTLLGVRRGDSNGITASYVYLKNRINYGVSLVRDTNFFYLYDYNTGYFIKVDREYDAGVLFAEYPFNTFLRAELRFGYIRKNYDSRIPYYSNLDENYGYIEPALVGDTTGFKPLTQYWEPYRGQRFKLSVRFPVKFSSDDEDNINAYYDYRAYQPVSKRSLIAIREWGAFSMGDDPDVFGVGGYDTIRGYDFNTLAGNYFAISNIELRFPLVDVIRFPGNITIGAFRGKFFTDIGAVWNKGQDTNWEFDDPDTRKLEGNLFASAGFGVNFWLIGAEWHFEWARKTDFTSFGGDWVYQWSIRRSF